MPQVEKVCRKILREAHQYPYTIHPIDTKMYKNLKNVLLMAENEERYWVFSDAMSCMPTNGSRTSSFDGKASKLAESYVEVGEYLDGLRCGIGSITRRS